MGLHLAPENDTRALLDLPDPEPSLRVAVVVPVYNRVDLLARTLAGLTVQTYPRDLVEVVVADDGSDEDVAAVVDRFTDRLTVTLIRRDHDGYGAGQARNLGVAHTDAPVVVFVDADCIPDPDLVGRHARWHHLADNLVVIGARHHLDTSTVDPDAITSGRVEPRRVVFGSDELPAGSRSADFRAVLHRRTADLRHGDEAFRSLVSSNFSVRRDRFRRVGGFSEDFHRWGGEDTELGWRLFCAGLFFVPDDRAVIYHQTQTDAGPAGWRRDSRARNQGLIERKIPHRFYRTPRPGYLFEVPKVTWVIHPVVDSRVEEVWRQLLAQSLTDWEVIVPDPGPETTVLAELLAADPRFRTADDLADALHRARGEYLALLHGRASIDHRLASRAVARLERHPRASLVRVAYQVPTTDGRHVYRRPVDVAVVDAAWGEVGLPVFALARRREWGKALAAETEPERCWGLVEELSAPVHLSDPLVALPASSPGTGPVELGPLVGDRTLFVRDLKKGPKAAVPAVARYAATRLAKRPYRRLGSPPPLPPDDPGDGPVPVRYVGWAGHDNLGDEALVEATRRLLPWAELATSGPAGRLLLLGGGTLINRGYLKHLAEHDSPRVERAVFGTGVANPEFWGEPRERPADWVEFLSTCTYVGVRGPTSVEILRSWGFRGEVEVVGDPALALEAPPTDPHPGRVVVCPAFTRGLLWGDDDRRVLTALAELVERLVADGRDVHLLSAFPGDDRHVFELIRRAGHSDLPYVAGYDTDLDEVLSLLASADVVVAERLHAAVLAAAAGTPFVAVEYRPKVADFARSVDSEEMVVRADAVSADRLTRLVARVDRDRTGITATLAEHVGEYRRRLRRGAERIREALT